MKRFEWNDYVLKGNNPNDKNLIRDFFENFSNIAKVKIDFRPFLNLPSFN